MSAEPRRYGRPPEQEPGRFSEEAGRFDRYEPQAEHHGPRGEDARAYAAHLRDAAERGWRKMSERMRHMQHDMKRTFEEDRQPEDVKPGWRAGGMFGGDDRSSSLFSHGNGLPAPGPHSGKGPRGYIRSDERICEDINDRLLADGRLDASEIEVRVEAGEATLSGHVMSREDKRRAEDLAESVSGVKHLQNNLRVTLPKTAEPSSAQAIPQSPDASSGAKIDPRDSDMEPKLN
jgi:hypothetical protein